jgi:hypothetical protein
MGSVFGFCPVSFWRKNTVTETSQKICIHLLTNPNQAQCSIDGQRMCAPDTADYLEKLARAPAMIAADVRFDQCGHNGQQPCNLCRLGVSSCIALLYSFTRINGDEWAARKLARLLKRMKARHGHLFYIGQHPHEQIESPLQTA